MQYQEFSKKLKSELPINRKERFYTATVLPSLLFHDGLSNLFRFLKEIKGFPSDINEENTGDNFLFYTEYNLKESAGKKSVGAEIYTVTGDTPDAIIEILEPTKAFVVIEAKMFANLTQNEFKKQMQAQKKAVIEILQEKYELHDNQMFHIALTPNKLKFIDTNDYQVINWEFFIENDDIDVHSNYFYNFLRFALENYNELLSDKFGPASTVEDEIPGIDIYKDGTDQKTLWVGRKGGKKTVTEDVRKNIWRERLYCINTEKPKDGVKGNWLSSKEFVDIVDQESDPVKYPTENMIKDLETRLSEILERFDSHDRLIPFTTEYADQLSTLRNSEMTLGRLNRVMLNIIGEFQQRYAASS